MTIEQLSEMGITEAESIAVYADLLKRSVARLESLRAMAVDTVAAPNQEKAKRDLLAQWRGSADSVATAVNLLERGPVDAETISNEVNYMLRLGWSVYNHGKVSPVTPPDLDGFFRERANNIAQVYAGRVAREPAETDDDTAKDEGSK